MTRPGKKQGGAAGLPPWTAVLIRDLLQGRAGNRRRSRESVTNNAGLVREETALTGGARNCRVRRRRVGVVQKIRPRHAGFHERVTALGAARKNCVDDARTTGATCTGIEAHQSERVSNVRARSRVVHFTRVDRTNRTHGRRFVGRHLRLDKVRDCDRRDDKNNRHNDQELNQRKPCCLSVRLSSFVFLLHDLVLHNLVILSPLKFSTCDPYILPFGSSVLPALNRRSLHDTPWQKTGGSRGAPPMDCCADSRFTAGASWQPSPLPRERNE